MARLVTGCADCPFMHAPGTYALESSRCSVEGREFIPSENDEILEGDDEAYRPDWCQLPITIRTKP